MKHIITQEDAQIWANALRSGEFKQSKHTLQDAQGFCCLGVACKVFIPTNKQIRHTNKKFLCGGKPDSQPNAPLWLQQINRDLLDRAGTSFVIMNDSFSNYTFDEIADIIELVYVHRALDEDN